MKAQMITMPVFNVRLKNDIHGYEKGESIRLLSFCGKMILEDDLSKKNKRIVPFDMFDTVQ